MLVSVILYQLVLLSTAGILEKINEMITKTGVVITYRHIHRFKLLKFVFLVTVMFTVHEMAYRLQYQKYNFMLGSTYH